MEEGVERIGCIAMDFFGRNSCKNLDQAMVVCSMRLVCLVGGRLMSSEKSML